MGGGGRPRSRGAHWTRADFPLTSSRAQIFFTLHDPTTPNRQGNDVGPQYRSIILTHSDEQRRVAEEVSRRLWGWA